jgi:beta-galactosidase GanA
MRFPTSTFAVLLLVAVFPAEHLPAQEGRLPHLEKRGVATQLIVDGKPFLILGGELLNSSSSSLDFMNPVWVRLAATSLNTVLTPLSWELVEPTEGKFNFALVDGLLAQARDQHLHVVFLWFGSWKNGMSSYVPLWVKQDTRRFPRVVRNGDVAEILTPLATVTRDADARAFAAVMRHLRDVDAPYHTVLLMQVENEVGVLGDTRDHSSDANRAFGSLVPDELLSYLKTHKDSLDPELGTLWEQNGGKTVGTWTQVFGDTSRADEIFMAWHYARYVNAVATKGKAEYDIPMYVNTWLAGEDAAPGEYPSGGPEPRVLDVWKAAGTSVDLYSPDLYAPDFASWCQRYHRAGNPLFIPETRGYDAGAANVFYAVGEHGAFGFSPFAIDRFTFMPEPSELESKPSDAKPRPPNLGTSYSVLAQLWPLLQKEQPQGAEHGFLLDKDHPSVEYYMNGYVLHVSLDQIFGSGAEKGFGLIIAIGPDEFLGAGTGFRVSFATRSPRQSHVGLASVDEGEFQDGKWIPGRRLNGDETDQGTHWRFDPWRLRIEKAVLYRFQ